MKKVIFLAASAIVFSFVVSAQTDELTLKQDVNSKDNERTEHRREVLTNRNEVRKLDGKEVSSSSKKQFNKDFGTIADVKWVRSPQYDEATFTKDGKKLTAYYGNDFKLVGTTSDISFADLPVKAQKEIAARYKEHSNTVVFYDDNEANETDILLWNDRFVDKDNYFIKVKKDNKEIVLQINPEGDIFYFTEIKKK